ncbi:MAG TPA: hypothetical protein VFZ67_02465, partial [Nitrososphaera sp.]
MIIGYAEVDMMRLLLIVMPLLLMLSSILPVASATNNTTIPAPVSNVNLSNTPNVDSIDPQIATSGNHVYISWWEDYGNGTRVPFFKASDDNGLTFESVLSLSDNGPIPVQDNNINIGY